MGRRHFDDDRLRLGNRSSTRFCHRARLETEEDIASSFEELYPNDLFFFFGSFWLLGKDILLWLSPASSSQAPSAKSLPVKNGSLCACGVDPGQAEADLKRLGELVVSRKPEEVKEV